MKIKLKIKIYKSDGNLNNKNNRLYQNHITILYYLIYKYYNNFNDLFYILTYLPLKFIQKYIINKKIIFNLRLFDVYNKFAGGYNTLLCKNNINLNIEFILKNIKFNWYYPQFFFNDAFNVVDLYNIKHFFHKDINTIYLISWNKNLNKSQIKFFVENKIHLDYEMILNLINKNYYYNLKLQDIKIYNE